jgi:tetratricopeptide (TPR) repeat protein
MRCGALADWYRIRPARPLYRADQHRHRSEKGKDSMIKRGLAFIYFVLLLGIGSVSAFGQNPDSLDLGNLAYSRGQYDIAISEYTRVLSEIGGNRSAAHYNIGVCYQHMERFNEAIEHYRSAIKIREDRYPVASYALGVTLEELGRPAEAKEAFRQAVKAAGGSYPAAAFEIGLLSQQQGDLDEAAHAFRAAMNGSGKNAASCHNNLGIVLALSGDYGQAEGEFMVALKQSRGKLAEARRNLALCKQLYAAPALVAELQASKNMMQAITPAGS